MNCFLNITFDGPLKKVNENIVQPTKQRMLDNNHEEKKIVL